MTSPTKIALHQSIGNWRRARRRYSSVRAWCGCTAIFLLGLAAAAQTDATHPLSINEKSFRCVTEMTHIGHSYVDNLAGNLKGTVEVAKSRCKNAAPVSAEDAAALVQLANIQKAIAASNAASK